MDHDIVTRVQRGDEQAFESLVKADFSRLYRVARGVLGDPHLAEDATQQTFLVAQRKLYQLREPEKADRWLFAILRSCYLKGRRRRRPIPAASRQ